MEAWRPKIISKAALASYTFRGAAYASRRPGPVAHRIPGSPPRGCFPQAFPAYPPRALVISTHFLFPVKPSQVGSASKRAGGSHPVPKIDPPL